MARESVVDQIVKSLSFEVEAVPQDNDTKLTSTSNSTPLNVKIRVRKKDESGLQQGILSVPKFGSPDANPERIRLISSDQTIMSFNVSMEADFVKKPKRKPRKLFFGGCLGTQYDDDEVPYTPSSAYNAKITETSTSSKSDGIIRQKFTLSKTNYDNTDALQHYSKKHSILGKCKPGGCLDPPFNEEKYSYEPMLSSRDEKPRITQDAVIAVKDHAKIKLRKADNGQRTSKESKQLSKDSLVQKTKAKIDDDSTSILSIYENSLQGSLDSKYSDSVITYPPLTSPSAITNEKNLRNRISNDEKSRKSYDASIDAFFSSRKSSRFSEITFNADETKNENAKTIVPIPLPIPLPIPVKNTANVSEDTKRENVRKVMLKPLVNSNNGNNDTKGENTKTDIAEPLGNFRNGMDDTNRENVETIIPTTMENATTILETSESDITSSQTRDTKSPTKTDMELEPTVKVRLNKADLSTNNAVLEDLQKQSSYTDNPNNAKTSIPIPIPLPIHLKNATSISSFDESHITSPQVLDLESLQKTDLESEHLNPYVTTKMDKADLSTNQLKLNDLQKQSFYTDNHENAKTSIPIPIPIPENTITISKSNDSHLILPNVQASVSPKRTDMESEPTVIPKVDKVVLSTSNLKLDRLQEHSSYTDNRDDLNNETKITAPMIQSSHIGSLKSVLFTEATEGKNVSSLNRHNDTPPYDENSKISEKSAENKLDNEIVTPDKYKSASNKTKKYGENMEKIIQNLNPVLSKQNGIQISNKHISEDSNPKPSPKESAKSLEGFDVGSGRFVNPEEQGYYIGKQSFTDYIPEEYDHTKIIQNNENLAEDNIKQLNKLSLPTASTTSKDDKRIKSKGITELSTDNKAVSTISDNPIELNQEIAKETDYKVNKTQPDSNEDYSDVKESILLENKFGTDQNVQENTTDTLFDNENNVTNDKTNDDLHLDAEPMKYNRLFKPVNVGDSKSNVYEKHDNLTFIPGHTQSNLDQQKLSNLDSSQIEKLKYPINNDSGSKQSIIDKQSVSAKENLNLPTSVAISRTTEEQSPMMSIDKSIFVDPLKGTTEFTHVETPKYRPSNERISTQSDRSNDPIHNEKHKYKRKPSVERISTQSDRSKYFMGNEIHKNKERRISTQKEQSKGSMRNETHKYRPIIERTSMQTEQRKDSVNSSKLRFKPSSSRTGSKDSVENKIEASEISHQTPLTKGSISLDLAFQSFLNDKNERTLKTIDTCIDHERYPDDSITVIKSQLRPKINEIRIPIDMENDITIQIQLSKSPTQPMLGIEQEPFDHNKPSAMLSQNYGLSDLQNRNNYETFSSERPENISYTEIPSILNSVYEQELIPLQNTINNLKKEIASLASQQSTLIDNLVSARRTKPTRLLRVSSRCLCYR